MEQRFFRARYWEVRLYASGMPSFSICFKRFAIADRVAKEPLPRNVTSAPPDEDALSGPDLRRRLLIDGAPIAAQAITRKIVAKHVVIMSVPVTLHTKSSNLPVALHCASTSGWHALGTFVKTPCDSFEFGAAPKRPY